MRYGYERRLDSVNNPFVHVPFRDYHQLHEWLGRRYRKQGHNDARHSVYAARKLVETWADEHLNPADPQQYRLPAWMQP